MAIKREYLKDIHYIKKKSYFSIYFSDSFYRQIYFSFLETSNMFRVLDITNSFINLVELQSTKINTILDLMLAT